MVFIQKSKQTFLDQYNWNKIVQILWLHLQTGLNKLDDQLLCATCFYNALSRSETSNRYLKNIAEIIDTECLIYKSNNRRDGSNNVQVISLMYGIFQSSFLSLHKIDDIELVKEILTKTFDILVLMANIYSHYTFIVFKIIDSFKKVNETVFQESVFSKANQITMLNLVCHNWENPITGVRDLNKTIFKTLLTLMDPALYELTVNEINNFVWNKAKYLMLAEIILQVNKSIVDVITENVNWIEGVVYSLYKPGLVSAGADMYYAILKQIKSEDEWYSLFLNKIVTVLNGDTFQAKINFNNYWCLNTFKMYPGIFHVLFNEIISINPDNQANLYSILSLVKQANKLGIVCKKWHTSDIDDVIISFVKDGLSYIDPYVRMTAFDIVCISNGTSLPDPLEYSLVHTFLYDNVNSDCTVLRISMLNSLKIFLNRLHLSYINMAKNRDVPGSFIELKTFSKNMQELINSLSLHGNYQRKITIVKLCDVFLSSFNVIPRKKNDHTHKINKTLLQSLKDENVWLLSDKNFTEKLLMLLKDPSDDVREHANQILFNYYFNDLIELEMVNGIIDDAFHCIKSKFFYEVSCGYSMFKLVTQLLLKRNIPNIRFDTVEDLFSFVCIEFINEARSQKDILQSIDNGSQLYTFISVLQTVLQVCLYNKYETQKLFQRIKINDLLETLENISNQFLHQEDSVVSSDFSEINDMVNNIIKESGCDPYDKSDQSKISGLHQIVLNTMWLNVKVGQN